jgi:hypothetical protein
MLGTYAVTANLGPNSCGTGLAAPTPWKFDVQMSEKGATLYWSNLDGNPPLSSAITADSAMLTATESASVDTAPDGGAGPCTLTRTDTLKVNLASGSPPPTFQGTIEYAFSAPGGVDCSDQLSANGGTYDTLPCSVSYAMTGVRQ